jgi:hypothetical protein
MGAFQISVQLLLLSIKILQCIMPNLKRPGVTVKILVQDLQF